MRFLTHLLSYFCNQFFLYRVFLIFACIIYQHSNSLAQDCGTIVKHIDLGGDEVVWTSDVSRDGHIYLGGTVTRPNNIKGAFIVKTNNIGDVIWTREIAGLGNQMFRKVYGTSDSGVISVGISSTYPSSVNFSAMVVKWDKNGNREWSKSLRTNSNYGDWAISVMETSDGGFVVTGNINSAGYFASGSVLKLDKAGNALWMKKYPFFEGVDFRGAYEADDSYIIAGDYLFNSNTIYRPLVLKLNKANGNVILLKSFSLDGRVLPIGPLLKRNNGYYLNCINLRNISGIGGGYIHTLIYLKENLDFEKAIKVDHAIDKNNSELHLVSLPDGGFVASNGGTNSTDDADMYRADANGQITWKLRIGGDGAQQLGSTSQIAEDDFVFSGFTETPSGGKDILWIRASTKQNNINAACDLIDSDAKTIEVPISNVNFSFETITDLPLNFWVNINPTIVTNSFKNISACKQLEVSNDTLVCSGATIGLFAKGGVTYSWSPVEGLDNPSIENPKATVFKDQTYFVSATTASGCILKDSVKLTVRPAFDILLGADRTLVCSEDSVQLNAQGGLTYSWSPSFGLSNTNIPNPKAWIKEDIMYKVLVSDVNNCIGMDSIFIRVREAPVFQLTPTNAVVCSGDSVSLLARGGNTYQWFENGIMAPFTDSVLQIIPKVSATYSVRITDTLCLTSDSLYSNIIVNILPVTDLRKSNDINCDIVSSQLDASGGISYIWSPILGLNNPTIPNPVSTVKASTRYTVTVTGTNGCVVKDSIDILFSDYKKLIITPDTTVCKNENIQLLASGAKDYEWFPSNGLNNSQISNPIATFVENTIYFVRGTTLNGCVARDSVKIIKKPDNDGGIAEGRRIACGKDTILMEAFGGSAYKWSPSGLFENPDRSITNAIIEKESLVGLEYLNDAGCKAFDSVLITWKPAPVFKITPEISRICKGESVTIGVEGGNRFRWTPEDILDNNSAREVTATPDANIAILVNVWDDGCMDSTILLSEITILPSPLINLSKSNDINCGTPFAQLFATGDGNFLWEPVTGLDNPQVYNPIASPGNTTIYRAILTDSLGCSNTDSITVFYTPGGDLSFYQLPNAFTPNNDGLNDCFGISRWGQGIELLSFEIYNRWGQVVFSGSRNNICWDGSFKGKHQPSGTYVYNLKANAPCGLIDRKGNFLLVR